MQSGIPGHMQVLQVQTTPSIINVYILPISGISHLYHIHHHDLFFASDATDREGEGELMLRARQVDMSGRAHTCKPHRCHHTYSVFSKVI